MTSASELSLGAHGGAVCFRVFEAPVLLLLQHSTDDDLHTLLAHLTGASRRIQLQYVNQLLVLW